MRSFIFLSFAALLFSLFFFLLKSDNKSGVHVRFGGASFIEGLKIINKKGGNQSWVLTAKRADIDERLNEAHLKDMEVSIKEGDVILRADTAIYDLMNKTLAVTSTVTAHNKSYSLVTDNVTLDSLANNLESSGSVKMKGKTFVIEGKGMEIINKKQKVKILKDVSATFNNN
jgi:LPS export ABC transporter protein LptC